MRGGMGRQDFETETLLAVGGFPDVAHALRGEGFDASEDGTGRWTPIVPVAAPLTASPYGDNASQESRLIPVAIQAGALRENPDAGPDGVGVQQDVAYTLEARSEVQAVAFDCKASGRNGFGVGQVSPTLRAMGHKDSHTNAGGQVAVAFNLRGREGGAMPEMDEVASVRAASGGSSRSYLATPIAVRRLTVVECERLQGLPDGFTAALMPKGRWRTIEDDEAPYLASHGHTVRQREDGAWETNIIADGPRYKMIGNGMCKNVMLWIGQRIQAVEEINPNG